jgi:ABC-2 type transport system permease protein
LAPAAGGSLATAASAPAAKPADGLPTGAVNAEVSPGRRQFAPTLRFFGNELRITFFRRRNQLLLLVAVLFPLLIGIGLKAAAPHGGGGGGNGPGANSAAFFNQLAGNGVFLTFIALSLLLILVLPVVVAVVAGDSIAGEAGYGTLRYLLAVPAGRSRLLLVKYAAIVVWCVAAVFIVSATALAVGAVLFPVGPVTLLSGTTVSLASGLVSVLWVTLYLCAAMAAVGAIGLAISTFTEHSIGAIAALMILIVASEVVDNIPQFATVAPYLPTHWWNSFDALLRTPVDTTTLWHGLLSFGVYAVVFVLIAWARFTSSDVTS